MCTVHLCVPKLPIQSAVELNSITRYTILFLLIITPLTLNGSQSTQLVTWQNQMFECSPEKRGNQIAWNRSGGRFAVREFFRRLRNHWKFDKSIRRFKWSGVPRRFEGDDERRRDVAATAVAVETAARPTFSEWPNNSDRRAHPPGPQSICRGPSPAPGVPAHNITRLFTISTYSRHFRGGSQKCFRSIPATTLYTNTHICVYIIHVCKNTHTHTTLIYIYKCMYGIWRSLDSGVSRVPSPFSLHRLPSPVLHVVPLYTPPIPPVPQMLGNPTTAIRFAHTHAYTHTHMRAHILLPDTCNVYKHRCVCVMYSYECKMNSVSIQKYVYPT